MSRYIKFVLLFICFCPSLGFGDGKMFWTQYEANIKAPKQQAILFFKDKKETLILESHFSNQTQPSVIVASNTRVDDGNYAWVVPLPNKPEKIEPVQKGYMKSVTAKFGATIVDNISDYWLFFIYLGVSAIILRILLIYFSDAFHFAIVGFLIWWVFITMGIISHYGGTISSVFSTDSSVKIYEQKTIGAYETVTLTSADANELLIWLNDNGFYVSNSILPVVESYIKDKWVFFVAKLSQTNNSEKDISPHPLSFTFQSERAVYPLKLTGFGNGSCSVMLYTVSEKEGQCKYFETRQTQKVELAAGYPYVFTQKDTHSLHELEFFSKDIANIFASSSVIVTKLVGNLSEAMMSEDARINWIDPTPKDEVYYSKQSATEYCLNWALPIPLIGLLLWLWYYQKCSLKEFILLVLAFVIGVIIYHAIYSTLPVADVKMTMQKYTGALSGR